MIFISRYANYRIILKSRRWKEVDGTRFLTDGLTIEFQNGQFETEEKDVIKALKDTRQYGSDYWTDQKEADAPSREATRLKNEEAEYKQKLASQCPECGKKFDTEFALTGHMKTHER